MTTANFPVQRVQMPTYADVYCAGFISRQTLPDVNFVAGGLETPGTTKFVRGDIVFLEGSGYTPGAEYEIIRALRDINEYEMFPGQRKLMKDTGQPYAEIGRVRILDTRSRTAVAHIEYACDPINPGDTAIPFAEKSMVAFHPPLRFDRFLPTGSKVSGRIVMGRDFDSELGTGQKVYMNVGTNQGVKVGDYFRAVRSYVADLNDPVDSLSFKAAISEDTQMKSAFVRSPDVHQGERPGDSRPRSATARGRRDCRHRNHTHHGNWNDRVRHGRCSRRRRSGTGRTNASSGTAAITLARDNRNSDRGRATVPGFVCFRASLRSMNSG